MSKESIQHRDHFGIPLETDHRTKVTPRFGQTWVIRSPQGTNEHASDRELLQHILARLSRAEMGLEQFGAVACHRCEVWTVRRTPKHAGQPTCPTCLDTLIGTAPEGVHLGDLARWVCSQDPNSLTHAERAQVERWSEHLDNGERATLIREIENAMAFQGATEFDWSRLASK